MINEHDRAVLNVDVPSEGLKAGDIGTVVHVYTDAKAFEVEFVTLDGHTAAVLTLESAQIRSVKPGEIPHARDLAAA